MMDELKQSGRDWHHHGSNRPPKPTPIDRVRGLAWPEAIKAVEEYEQYEIILPRPRPGVRPGQRPETRPEARLDRSRAGGLKKMRVYFGRPPFATGRFVKAAILEVCKQYGVKMGVGGQDWYKLPSAWSWHMGTLNRPDDVFVHPTWDFNPWARHCWLIQQGRQGDALVAEALPGEPIDAKEKIEKRIAKLDPDLPAFLTYCFHDNDFFGYRWDSLDRYSPEYGQDFPELAWYVSWESPYGEGAVGEELGSPRRDGGRVNPAYDAETSRLDLSKLAYDPDLAMTGRGRTAQQRRELPFRGSLFFDMDGDGHYDPRIDFRHQPVRYDAGQGPKFWYSTRLLREAERRGLFGGSWPAHVATVEEAKEFWYYRDATGRVPDAVHKIPNLAVIIVANERDHMQVAPDHPHIRIQANAFQKAGARFVRVNPDRAYVEWLSGERRPGLVDNDAGVVYTPKTIHAALCPNEAAHRILQVAAMCELADRVQAGNFRPNLHRVLFADVPKPAGPPPRRSPRSPRGAQPVPPPSRQRDKQ